MVSASVVAPNAHLELKSSLDTLQTSSNYAWQQLTYFLCAICMESVQINMAHIASKYAHFVSRTKLNKKNDHGHITDVL
jgi:hypothetical protein